MRIGGQPIDEATIARIQRTVDGHPELSRTALSRRLCAQHQWRARNGQWQEVSCRKMLVKLQRAGRLRLPQGQPFGARARGARGAVPSGPAPAAPPALLRTQLKALQPLELVRVGSADSEASRIWNALMERHHYLGAGPLCGAQLRYLIRSATHGWLGGLAFSAAAWQVRARDAWIGWSAETREKHLQRVVCNSRFLILPHVQVPHLASHVLGRALRRLGPDFRQRYGYEPLLVETFVERERFAGTCYRAANFIEVGCTQGRGREDRAHHAGKPIKRVWVYPLVADARDQLCAGVPAERRAVVPVAAADWAEAEFGAAPLPDQRLRRRLVDIARDVYARPQAALPQACQSRARTKAAYRFFAHPETQMDVLLTAHQQATVRRIAEQSIVLCPQDTTSLNYSTHPATQGLGLIGSDAEGPIGLMLHDTLAFSVAGTPLGVLDAQCWARDPATFGRKHTRKQRPIEDKESVKWLRSFQRVAEAQRDCPHTMLVSMGDRESDLYELFHMALRDPHGPKLLVRAKHDRLLAEGQGRLWAAVASQPLAGTQQVRVPRRPGQPARVAQLEVRFAAVKLKPPPGKAALGPAQLWAVWAQETAAPEGREPIHWMLLTTLPVHSLNDAVEKLTWYTRRWGIEIFHKTLKSGCKVEARQLGSADSLKACLAIDMVVAWRVYHLTKLGRETSDVPCSVFFEDAEWKALMTFATQQPVVAGPPPSLHEAMREVARLGGFLGRKRDGDPGTKSLWLGLQRLDDITAAWKIFVPHLRGPPVPSA